jgi:hypothetical protein
MMFNFLPEVPAVVALEPPTTTDSAITTPYINCAKAEMIWFVCIFKQAATHATVVSLYQATSSAGAGATPVTNTMPYWYSDDISSSSELTRGTNAATVTLSTDVADQVVVIQLDPSALTLTSNMDWVAVHTTASDKSTNFLSVTAIVVNRHGGYDHVNLLT